MLNIEGVTVRFGGLVAVNNVSMHVDEGKITGLIGPNGAGKTTLFNCISGVQRVDSGKIFYEGHEITNFRGYRLCEAGIARTYQVINLFRNMSVLDNVMIGCHCRIRYGFFDAVFHTKRMRDAEKEARQKAQEKLLFMGLQEKSDMKAGQLPYGEQRLLEIARALATEPKVILLDEPAAGMNATEKAALNGLVQKIVKMGIAVLIIEHHMDVIMQISDYVYVMNDGFLLAEGSPHEVQNNKAVIDAYLGGD